MSNRTHSPLTLLTLLLLSAGCADYADTERPAGIDSAIAAYRAESTATAADSSVVQPAFVVTSGDDTLVAEASYLCGKEMGVLATYWKGSSAWVRLVLPDSSFHLNQTTSASGARYGNDPPGPQWWVKGDSARLSWLHQSLQCAVNDDVVF